MTAEGAGMIYYLRRFGTYGRPFLGLLSLGVVLRIGELLADLAQPWPLAVIVDSVLGSHPLGGVLAPALQPFGGSRTSLLTAAVIASVVLAAISAALDYLGDRIMNGAGERVTAAIRTDLFVHLQRLPLAYHDRHPIGELVSRVSVDTSRIEDALVDIFSTLLPGVLTIVGLFAVMLAVSWQLGLVAMASVPLVAFTIYRYSRLTRQAARAVRQREGVLAAQVTEALVGIRTVQALGRYDVHDKVFMERNRRTLGAGLRAVDLRARFTPLVELSTAAGTGLLLWVGAWGVLHGAWTLGLLLVVLTYVRNLLKPIRSLSRLSLTLSRGSASAERVAAMLDEPRLPSPTCAPARLAKRARGHIELRNVCFGYDRGSVLDGIDLAIRPGEKVAIVGPNGAGKSSILALMARLYDPEQGDVLLDGVPVRQVPLPWLRSQVAVVLQDTFLFSGTLWQNIAYGKLGARRQEILDASRHALVDDFVSRLPEKFNTLLGDRGIGLSGGQKQRIAIARALLVDAPVVLLDEPTSGLDLAAEQVVVRALRELMQGRTVVMVTHRPALLALADRIVRIENGMLHEVPPLRMSGAAGD